MHIIGILVFYIYHYKKNKRKIRANELEDNYEYITKNEDNNPLIGWKLRLVFYLNNIIIKINYKINHLYN